MATASSTSFRLASRLDDVGFSDIVKLRDRIMQMRAQGARVFQFEGGEPFGNTPEEIKAGMMRALADNKTRYAPSAGIAELRTAISAKLLERNRIIATPDEVLLSCGGMHGLFATFQAIVNPGDEALIFAPYWTPIKDLVSQCQGRAVQVPITEARRDGFAAALMRYATDRTKVIYYNTPQNPTGVVFSREDAEAVANVARELDVVVVADEAYEDLVYDAEHVSIASLEGMLERTITCFTMSKSYSMTGWRVGYVVATEPWMGGLKRIVLNSTNGISTPTQWAALEALRIARPYFDATLAGYRARRDAMVNGLNALGLTCAVPAGSFFAFPTVTRIAADSRTAATLLLEKAQVSAVPGVVFGEHGEGHVRFSFSTSLEEIRGGLESIKKNL